ncbi:xylulose kinase [Starkeya sp. ORNL1]|uniref:FGGY-family carbohydrate kinase n=1 Tax=Starkeya sp. ORNL1 TaxID=2709380 RepID=UPI0014645CC8|nr:FGGY family carbohydrate kinase [Starkeya sp. ORNL1]QJP16383.1 xylulose kinase [Starkeya sp. ORNL1]
MNAKARRAFVGIDAGTTGCTVMIFDEHGNQLGHGYKEYPCVSPRPAWSEQDVDAVWEGICAASQQATSAANLPADAYASIGFSSQRGTFITLDADKNPIGTSIVWNDGRAVAYQALFGEEISPRDYHTHTGMQLSPLWAAAKIAWLRDNEPERFEKTRWFANGQEYFLYRLGAEAWETDPASLTLNGMMEIDKLDWSDRVLALCGIGRDRLPPVGIPSGYAGKVSRAAAEATGLPEGTPLCRGAGDQQCAAIGAGVIKQGMAEFTVGTSGVMVAHLDGLDRIKGRNLWWGGHGVPNAWDIEGAAFSLGACLKWWRNTLGSDDVSESVRSGRSPYSIMVEEASKSPPGAKGLMFHSFLTSQVTPYYDAVSRGGFLGIGIYHSRPDLIRALLEGCAHEMKMVVNAFQSDIDGGITDFRLTGGGTKSNGFVQIMTDIIGLPARVTRERECTVLGAAILGAFGAGAFSSIEEAVGAMVQVEADFEPKQMNHTLYDDQHQIYRGLYEAIASAGQYQKLADFSARYY